MKPNLSSLFVSIVFLLFLSACSEPDDRDPLLIEAESGDASAQFSWAQQIGKESGREKEAMDWYQRAADQGHAEAQYQCVLDVLIRASSDDEEREPLQKMEALAEGGNEDAKYLLGRRHAEDGNFEKAKEYLEKAAADGDSFALFCSAKVDFELGATLEEPLSSAAIIALRKAAGAGSSDAYYFLGRDYSLRGDISKADQNFLKAAELEHPRAMYEMGKAYSRTSGYGAIAFEYLSKAEAAGVHDALYLLSRSYFKGIGVEKSIEKGGDLLELAASFGDEEAIVACHASYITVDKPTFKQQVWLEAVRRFSDQSFVKEMKAIRRKKAWLSQIYDYDDIVDYDFKRIALTQKAYLSFALNDQEKEFLASSYYDQFGEDADVYKKAIRGHSESAVMMSELYSRSDLSYFDLDKSITWKRRASELGHKDASYEMYELLNQSGSEEWFDFLQRATTQGHELAKVAYADCLLNGRGIVQNFEAAFDLYIGMGVEGRAKAKEIVKNGHLVDMEIPGVREFVRELGDEGLSEFRYLAIKETLRAFEESQRISTKVPFKVVVSEFGSEARKLKKGTKLSKGMSRVKKAIKQTSSELLTVDVKNAIDELTELSELGFTDALYDLSILKFWGFYVGKDRVGSVEIWEKLSLLDDQAIPKYFMAFVLKYGYNREVDLVRAAQLLRASAEEGEDRAKRYFSDLNTVNFDIYDSIFDYGYRASVLLEPEAMVTFARKFKRNQRLDLEYRNNEYYHWLGEAAKLKNTDALSEIGIAYISGVGVEKNVLRGIRYIEEAATYGDKEALFYSGILYIHGTIVPGDIARGFSYLNQARSSGNLKAEVLLDVLSRRNLDENVEDSRRGELLNIVGLAGRTMNYFPVKPYNIQDGELVKVTGVSGVRATYELAGKMKPVSKTGEFVFLADDEFGKGNIDVTKVLLAAPVLVKNGALIFTGLEPEVSFVCESSMPIPDCYCLLVFKDGYKGVQYIWRKIGDLSSKKESKVKFPLKDMLFSNDAIIAIHFFSGEKEIASDIRLQLQYFVNSEIGEFSSDVYREITSKTVDSAPRLYRETADYLTGDLLRLNGQEIVVDVNEYGFPENISVSKDASEVDRSKLIKAASRMTFYPSFKEGELRKSTVKLKL